MKKILVISLVFVALSVALTACGFIDLSGLFGRGNDDSDIGSNGSGTASNDDKSTRNSGDGIYEGELDENGKFTGWGIWLYHNFRYEGYFVDGLPNGEGVLSCASVRPSDLDTNYSYATIIITEGTFVDGYAHGMIKHTWYLDSGNANTWNFETNMGYSTIIDEEIWGTALIDTRPDVSLTV
ncbi:MAG: hypothetical protein LBC73_00580, partial [Oscillospiraceae bacterium]|nr:hypothetical protein [Oscillospiraceae bacterium]